MRVGLKKAGNPGCPQPGVLETPSDRGGWRTAKNSLRCVCHLTRGFTPIRTGSVRLLEGVKRGGV